jgi:ParB-like chromosome segregation protein Spo0J
MPKYPPHPAADIFPLLPETEKEFQELVADIKTNGLIEPIWIFEDQILDGRNRARACETAGVPPRYEEADLKGQTPLEFVVSKNLHRRHLTATQRAAIAAEILPKLEELAKKRMSAGGGDKRSAAAKSGPTKLSDPNAGDSRAQAAKQFQVSPSYVSQAKAALKQNPALHAAMKTGTVKMPAHKRVGGKVNPPKSTKKPSPQPTAAQPAAAPAPPAPPAPTPAPSAETFVEELANFIVAERQKITGDGDRLALIDLLDAIENKILVHRSQAKI